MPHYARDHRWHGTTIPLEITNPANYTLSLAAYAPSLIHQVVTSPNSSLAVVTYESASATPGTAQLPVYKVPAPGSAGSFDSRESDRSAGHNARGGDLQLGSIGDLRLNCGGQQHAHRLDQ